MLVEYVVWKIAESMYYFVDYRKFEVKFSVTQPWNINQADEFFIVKVPSVNNHLSANFCTDSR